MSFRKFLAYILKPISRFLGVDALYLARGGFWLGIGNVVGIGIAFILSIAYARYISPEVYGNYRYVLSVIGIAGVCALPGMGVAITRSVARGFHGTFKKVGRIIFLSSFGMTVISIIIACFFQITGRDDLFWGFLIAGLLVPFVEGLGNWRGYFDGTKEFQKKTLINITIKITYGILMLIAIWAIYSAHFSNTVSLSVLLGIYFLTNALANIIMYRRVIRLTSSHTSEEPSAIRYGFHMAASSIPTTVATYIDGILLYHFLGASSLALYSFTIAPLDAIKAVLTTMVTVSFPKISEQTKDTATNTALKKTLPSKIFKASILTTGIIIAYIICAPIIYNIFFPRYISAALFSQVFALSLILHPFSLFNTAIDAEGNTKKIYTYKILTSLTQILALLILIPPFGLWGAVYGRIIGRYINYILPFYFFKK